RAGRARSPMANRRRAPGWVRRLAAVRELRETARPTAWSRAIPAATTTNNSCCRCRAYTYRSDEWLKLVIGQRNGFPRIQNIARVERAFQRLHQLDRTAMLGHERIELVNADAVLAGASPTHRDRAHAHLTRERFGLFTLDRVVWIKQHDQMKVAVADVPDNRRRQSGGRDIRAGCEHALSQPRDRNAGVR